MLHTYEGEFSEKNYFTYRGNCCDDSLEDEFWGHIYNVGGGESCRVSCYEMFSEMFALIGIKDLSCIIESNWFARRNFHGQYYLDSDKLEAYLNFRSHGIKYFYNTYIDSMGSLFHVCKIVTKLPAGQKIMGKFIKKSFEKYIEKPRGTKYWIDNDKRDYINPFFISKEKWNEIKPLAKMKHFDD